MIKAIFWDFDGTLIYSNESFLCSLNAALVRYNYTIPQSILKQFLTGVCSWYLPSRSYVNNTKENWWIDLLNNVKVFCSENGIEEKDCVSVCKAFKENVINYEYRLYNDAEDILSYCKSKGYNNYLLTNNFPEIVKVVEGFELDKYFCDYFVSANIGYEKTRIEIFNYAIREANYPNVCYMVGDNPIADIQGAHNAGIKTILVHKKPSEPHPDFYCNELSDIKKIIVD